MKKTVTCLLLSLCIITCKANPIQRDSFNLTRDSFLLAHESAKTCLAPECVLPEMNNLLQQTLESDTPYFSLVKFVEQHPDFPIMPTFFKEIVSKLFETKFSNQRYKQTLCPTELKNMAAKEACMIFQHMLECMNPIGNSICIERTPHTNPWMHLLKRN